MEGLRRTDPRQSGRIRVLVLSRNYPNNVMELLGLWVQGQVREAARHCDVKVISPVPYSPPLPGLPEEYARFRRVARRRREGDVEILHPRFFLGPGYSTHRIEWLLYYAGVHKSVVRVRRDFPFDVIHAHFTYPDGVVAAHLGRYFGVPVVITEQNPWGPWLEKYPGVRRQAIWAARQSACQIAISRAVRNTIEAYTGKLEQLSVIPDGVDGSVFTLGETSGRSADQILFVGVIRPVKGLDVLLKAVRRLVDRGRKVTLLVIGEAFYTAYRQEELRLKKLASDLNLSDHVRFAGKQPFPELVRQMQRSAVLVLPSRSEALGVVLVEALACGTPVVATRSGGPEDVVNDEVGVLTAVDDPGALAQGIEQVLDCQAQYDPARLRAYALQNFGLGSVGQRLLRVYEHVSGRIPEESSVGAAARVP
jgi:glycosyltransferase involved in cell wall biosynthesis